MNLRSPSAATTRAVGAAIASLLAAGDVVVLTGELGAGKTEMAKGIIGALGVTEPVVSPTFTILREYDGDVPVHHLDVYRLDRVQEAIDLGLDELFDDGVMVIEWGEGVRALLPPDRLEVGLRLLDPDEADDDTRRLTIDPFGPGWLPRHAALESAVRAAAETTC
jgi:tRNA threonylcarbamoyladenosine biosynthesis protein TsaE